MSKYQTIVIEYQGETPPILGFKKLEGCSIVAMGLGHLMEELDKKEGLERPSERVLELTERLIEAGPKAAFISSSEIHEITDYIFSLAVDEEDQEDE